MVEKLIKQGPGIQEIKNLRLLILETGTKLKEFEERLQDDQRELESNAVAMIN